MRLMRVAMWAWHCGYIYMMAKALPEITFQVLPTPYNPSGWDESQRPMPANVRRDSDGVEKVGHARAGWSIASLTFADVIVAQTPMDLDFLARIASEKPALYLAHNHAALDGTPPERIKKMCRSLVAISPMKRDSWAAAGYDGSIDVIPPGIDLAEYADARWTGQGGYLLTVVNGLGRPLFDLQGWLRHTKDMWPDTVRLVGSGNDGIPGAEGPAAAWGVLKEMYRDCAYYLNPTRPPYEDEWNLAALEAAACGAPVQNLHGAAPKVEDFPIEAFRARWRRVLSEVAK